MKRWHIEFSAGGDGCLPEHVDVFHDQAAAMEEYAKITSGDDWPLDEDRPFGSTITVCPCTDDRCDWCREAGPEILPPVYAMMHDEDIAAFPLCAECAQDTLVLNDLGNHPLTQIEVVTHTRSEECMICERLVVLDPLGVDSRVAVPPGNRWDFVDPTLRS